MVDVPSEVVRLTLQEIIEETLASKDYKITISSASKSGVNNFIGIIYRAKFCKKGDDAIEKGPIHTLIVKIAPHQLGHRQRFHVRPLFLREIYMYKKVLPYFRHFEQCKHSAMDIFMEYPICYETITDDMNECIILEDLIARGFRMMDRFTEEVTADHIRLLMRILGKLHAVSFAIQDQQPQKFEELKSNMNVVYIRQNDKILRDYFNMMAKSVLDALSGDEDMFVRSKVTKLFEKDAIDIAADCVDSKSIESASVITHGDIWQNNTMFKYDKNGKPIEAKLLDWQMVRYSSPVLDIVYCIFSCTTKELRDAHYNEFLNIYHGSLSAHIQNLGSIPEKLFSHDLMMEHLRKFGKFALIMASTILPTVTTDSEREMNLSDLSSNNDEELANLQDHPLISKSSLTRFNKRIRDVAIDMVRLEYV